MNPLLLNRRPLSLARRALRSTAFRRARAVALAAGVAQSLAGCGVGALRQSFTADDCAPGDGQDHSCRDGFDTPLALGASARPDIRIKLGGSTAPGMHLESAAPSILDVQDGRVVGAAEGTSALLFVSDDHTVLDFLHVWVKKPTGLDLSASAPDRKEPRPVGGTIELLAGESIRLEVHPVAEGQHLVGAATGEWTIDPPIASLLREGVDDERRLVAERPGKASLRISMLGVATTVDVVVHAPPNGSAGRGGAQ